MKKLNTLLCALLVLGVSSVVFAQGEPAAPSEPVAPEEAADAPEEAAKPDEAAADAPADSEEKEEAGEEEAAAPVEEEAAEAAPAKSEVKSALSGLLVQAIEILTVVLMLLAGWLTKKGITFIEKKTKIDIPAKQEEMLASWAGKGVNYAREKAHQFALDNGEKMKGGDKLEAALGFGLSLAEEHGVTDLGKEKLIKYIESKLGESRSA